MAAEAPPLAYLRGPSVVYELEDAETSIGRNEDNDIVRGFCRSRRMLLSCVDQGRPAREFLLCELNGADNWNIAICFGQPRPNRDRRRGPGTYLNRNSLHDCHYPSAETRTSGAVTVMWRVLLCLTESQAGGPGLNKRHVCKRRPSPRRPGRFTHW
jgi:hypothetical protein